MSTEAIQQKTGTVVNTVVIRTPAERVWRAATEIERWPEMFPTVKSIRRTDVGSDEIIMEMTVHNELGANTVRSHRRYTPAAFRIDFEMWTLPPSIAAMSGRGTVEPLPGGARLVVVHDFVAQPDGQ